MKTGKVGRFTDADVEFNAEDTRLRIRIPAKTPDSIDIFYVTNTCMMNDIVYAKCLDIFVVDDHNMYAPVIYQSLRSKGSLQKNAMLPRREFRRKKWLEAIGTDRIKPNLKEIYICSLHFHESAFNRTMGVVRLRDDVIPLQLHGKGILTEEGNITQDALDNSKDLPTSTKSSQYETMPCSKSLNIPETSSHLFSWQKTQLIEADGPDEPPPRPPTAPADLTLAMYCDPDPDPDPNPTVDQAVPSQPAPAEKEVENRCKDCAELNEGFEFWCVQCSGGALCGACAGRPPHHAHHVLRAPMAANRTQTQAVLVVIRQQLQNESLLSPHETVDDGVKLEVKEEPAEAAPEAEPSEPAEPDPLACEPRAAPEQGPIPRIAEQIVDHHEPIKLPQLKKNLTLSVQQKLVKVSPAQVKGTFISQLQRIVTTQQHKGPQTMSQACKENLVRQPIKFSGHQGTKTSQTAGNFTGITRHNQARTQVPVKVISEPRHSETVFINLGEDETVEYLEEGLDNDIETLEEVVFDDNETNEDNVDDDDVLDEDDFSEADESDEDRIGSVARGVKRKVDARQRLTMRGPSKSIIREDDPSDEDPIVNVGGRGVKRKEDSEETPPVRGPYEAMARALPSKQAVVRVRPLSSTIIYKRKSPD